MTVWNDNNMLCEAMWSYLSLAPCASAWLWRGSPAHPLLASFSYLCFKRSPWNGHTQCYVICVFIKDLCVQVRHTHTHTHTQTQMHAHTQPHKHTHSVLRPINAPFNFPVLQLILIVTQYSETVLRNIIFSLTFLSYNRYSH